jgi:hypothetical protein
MAHQQRSFPYAAFMSHAHGINGEVHNLVLELKGSLEAQYGPVWVDEHELSAGSVFTLEDPMVGLTWLFQDQTICRRLFKTGSTSLLSSSCSLHSFIVTKSRRTAILSNTVQRRPTTHIPATDVELSSCCSTHRCESQATGGRL